MQKEKKGEKKLKLVPLVLMILTAVFGFNNIPRSFYLMGYAAIPWFILSGLTFFIPFALMMAEYGAAFTDKSGGMYTWMEKSTGPKYAFIGIFMQYSSYVIWMVNISSTIWIPLSNALFGGDKTSSFRFMGLNSTQVIGVLAISFVIITTIVISRGLGSISRFTSIGGSAVALLNIVLLIGALFVFMAGGGKVAQPLSGMSFVSSPNPTYGSPMATLAFIVFAIFAYGGTEAFGGVVDQTENAKVTFPRGVALSAAIIIVGYAIGIFSVGTFTDWNNVLSGSNVNIANALYVIMNNLGYKIGLAAGLSQTASLYAGRWMARYVGISMFLSMMGSFLTFSYSPIKQLIEGTPKGLWPGRMTEVKNGVPTVAVWMQCVLISLIIALTSFGGDVAQVFFTRLTLMANVSLTLPYLFLCGSYPAFKANKEINRPFEIFKTRRSANAAALISGVTVGFANLFTIIQPAMSGDLSSTLWMIAGPVIFSIMAWLMYSRYERSMCKEDLNAEKV